jgi:long-chain fatty acid transport protein
MATNGDNLIGIGPISRAMGGVGIAAPQDAISATFSNPAGMCFGPYCPGSEINFSGTLFLPRPETRISIFGGTTVRQSDSDDKTYAIPAFGLSVPINPQWRFGLAAYGISGLGVDYRDTVIDNPSAFGAGAPLVAGEYTQLQIMKFSPNLAYLVNDNLSLGIGLHIDYSALDLRSGSSFNYGYGVQVGAIYKVNDYVSLGATYKTPQSVDHDNVRDFDGDGTADDLELEIPQEIGVGIAVEPILGKLLIELDGKWVNWKDADGYEDFDWDDQIVIAVGAQFKPTEKLALRLGYNYAENPVEEHNNWNGTFGADFVNVQGKNIPRYYYETFRIVGFPAIVEHHLTAGIGYEVSDSLAFNIGYMHAFEETITETGTDLAGLPAVIESTLEEDSIEFGLTWRFQ